MSTSEQMLAWRKRREAIPCHVSGCPRGSTGGRGYCPAHYRRWREGLPVNVVPVVRAKNKGPCSVGGCDSPAHSKGWCRRHYSRFYRTGAPGAAALQKRGAGEGSCGESTKGYHIVCKNGRRRAAHILAMEELLGRSLKRGETVHHVNGQRSDNRTDGPLVDFRSGNLELWSSWQPSGQRVSDKVAYAVELLREYAPELLVDDQ